MKLRVRVYWYRRRNFGDLLARDLFSYYGYAPRYASPNNAEVVSIGSILGHMSRSFGGIILGSGFLWSRNRRSFPNAKILALRGKMTRVRTNAPKNTVLGDPGILASRLLKGRVERRRRIGLVPHYVDSRRPILRRLLERHGESITVIDVANRPTDVIERIAQCQMILSSSLHGIVCADSLGLPNAWIELGKDVLGHGFKFHDYYSTYNIDRLARRVTGDESLDELLSLPRQPSGHVPQVAERLERCFLRLADLL